LPGRYGKESFQIDTTERNLVLEEVQKEKLRTSSYVKYKKVINSYLVPELGHIQLQKLTPQQVQAFYTKKRKDGLAPKTVNSIHGILHGALDNAVRWNLVSRNVCDLVSPPKVVKPEIQALTLEQANKLLGVARGHRLETILTNPRYILKMFDRLLKEAGLPHIRFHDLRHSVATLLLSMGVDMKVIQEILGHSNIAMTADTYTHVSLTLQEDAMDRWNGKLGNEDDGDDDDGAAGVGGRVKK
jgi:integrase